MIHSCLNQFYKISSVMSLWIPSIYHVPCGSQLFLYFSFSLHCYSQYQQIFRQTTIMKPNSQQSQLPIAIGYLHLVIEKITVSNASSSEELIHAKISLGQVAKVDTTAKKSDSTFNEVFLIEVPENPSRLAIFSMEGQKKLGQCRYDVLPFFEYEAATHSIQSELYDDDNKVVGNLIMKITYYSARYGRLRVRIFGLQFPEPVAKQFEEAKVKVRIGVHAQTTDNRKLTQNFNQTVQVLVLAPNLSLTFEVIHHKGIIAHYTIKDISEGKVLQQESKAYQVSLFNNNKAIGTIKYQFDWLKPRG